MEADTRDDEDVRKGQTCGGAYLCKQRDGNKHRWRGMLPHSMQGGLGVVTSDVPDHSICCSI